jgi:hypothetical protein
VELDLTDVAPDTARPGAFRATLLRDDLAFDASEPVIVHWVIRDGRLVTGVALPA